MFISSLFRVDPVLMTTHRRKRSRLKPSGPVQATRPILNSTHLQNLTSVPHPTPRSIAAARAQAVHMMVPNIIPSSRANCAGYVKSVRLVLRQADCDYGFRGYDDYGQLALMQGLEDKAGSTTHCWHCWCHRPCWVMTSFSCVTHQITRLLTFRETKLSEPLKTK